jgi:hypothetical protein
MTVRFDIVGNRDDRIHELGWRRECQRKGDAGHDYHADRQVASDWSANLFEYDIWRNSGGSTVIKHRFGAHLGHQILKLYNGQTARRFAHDTALA